MSDKPKISGRETYVFSEEDLEELDETSLTGVMRDLASTLEMKRQDSQPQEDEDDELDFGSLNDDRKKA